MNRLLIGSIGITSLGLMAVSINQWIPRPELSAHRAAPANFSKSVDGMQGGGLAKGGGRLDDQGLVSFPAAILTGQPEHGPDAKCDFWCAPEGARPPKDLPEGMEVRTCAGTGDGQCARQGEMCGQEHQSGCSVFCKKQCCSCCSI